MDKPKPSSKLSKDALVISFLTLITVFTWMLTDIYRVFTKTETPQILKKQMSPLNPKIDRVVFDRLESRLFFSPQEASEALYQPEPSPEPTQTEESLTNLVPDQATESGQD